MGDKFVLYFNDEFNGELGRVCTITVTMVTTQRQTEKLHCNVRSAGRLKLL